MELFELQKLLMVALLPLGSALLLALIGALLRRRWPVLLAVAWLWLWSTPWAAMQLASYVQAGTPLQALPALPQADVILVLGGALNPGSLAEGTEPNLTDAGDRIVVAAELYRLHKAPRILFSGGPTDWGNSEAQAAATLLTRLGVAAADISVETQSRTTRENAQFSLPRLAKTGARRVLVVTSQWHMARAIATFRQTAATQGLDISFIAAPCDPVEIVDDQNKLRRWLPNAQALEASHRLLKELLGLTYARLFPG